MGVSHKRRPRGRTMSMHIPSQSGASAIMVVQMRRARFWQAKVLRFIALLLALGCGQEGTAPDDLGTLSFLVVSGDAQSGVVGTELPQPLVIKATKSNGAVLAG